MKQIADKNPEPPGNKIQAALNVTLRKKAIE